MSKIPTAKEFFDKKWAKGSAEDLLKEFAKLHVTEALKAAVDNAYYENIGKVGDNEQDSYELDKDSILNSYPLDNIK